MGSNCFATVLLFLGNLTIPRTLIHLNIYKNVVKLLYTRVLQILSQNAYITWTVTVFFKFSLSSS